MTPVDLDRFAKILGMLGSDHVGERAAAAAKATAWLAERGLCWADVSVTVPSVMPSSEAAKPAPAPAEPDMMEAARQARDHLAAMQKAAKRARWEANAHGEDADGFSK